MQDDLLTLSRKFQQEATDSFSVNLPPAKFPEEADKS